MSDYDAIIVGARCAGSAVALGLASEGLNVLLVDRATFPSDTVSTHLVKPRAVAYLDRWGLRPSLESAETPFRTEFSFTNEGIRVAGHATGGSLRQAFARDHGWHVNVADDEPLPWACIRRTELDSALIAAAERAGAVVRQDFAVRGVIFDEAGRAVGIAGGSGGRSIERSAIVVGADGRRSRVARDVRAPVLREALDCSFTYYAYFTELPIDDLDVGVHLRGRGGLGYCPTNHSQVMVSVWGPKVWAREFAADVERNFARSVRWCYPALAERMQDATRVSRFIGMLDQPNRVRRSSGPGWALVGDAAYQVDQCTAIGITNAFRGAQHLVSELAPALKGEIPLDLAGQAYQRAIDAVTDDYFGYVARAARIRPASPEFLGLLDVVQRTPTLANRFLDFSAGLLSVTDFLGPAGRSFLQRAGGDPSPEVPDRARRALLEAETYPWSADALLAR